MTLDNHSVLAHREYSLNMHSDYNVQEKQADTENPHSQIYSLPLPRLYQVNPAVEISLPIIVQCNTKVL